MADSVTEDQKSVTPGKNFSNPALNISGITETRPIAMTCWRVLQSPSKFYNELAQEEGKAGEDGRGGERAMR